MTDAGPRFRDLAPSERRAWLAERLGCPRCDVDDALTSGGLDDAIANAMVENAIGTLALPFGVARHFRVNGRDVLVPMVVEEPSVIAAASHAAKRALLGGGFEGTADPSIMAAQIAVHEVAEPRRAAERIRISTAELVARANAAVPGLVARGGGVRSIETRDLGDGDLVVHLMIDCLDAMGANLLNTAAEAVGARVAELAEGDLGIRILSNYGDRRLVRVGARIPVEALACARVDGPTAARGIARASRFAEKDHYRAVTHNKGIMNGVDAVVVATGNDFRAVEASAHAFAARRGTYAPLAIWRLTEDGSALEGSLEMPMALGIVGGALRAHRGARLALSILGVSSARELAIVVAAAGLATNLAALRALATEGIQRGHMALHQRALSSEKPPAFARVAASDEPLCAPHPR